MAAHEPLLILTGEQITQKINRLAFQIYEQNFEEKHVVVCGLAQRGFLLAEKIYAKLKEISGFSLQLCEVRIDKDNLHVSDIKLVPEPGDLKDKAVILCDDVLYTGKTLAYAAMPFLEAGAKKLECLVLIQRNYLCFPVQPTYVGMSLATTLQDHVNVNLLGAESVYLS